MVMIAMDEEQLERVVEELKARALSYVPVRYAQEYAQIKAAGSLRLLSLRIEAFLNRVTPRVPDDAKPVTNPSSLPSAQIAVHRVFKKNLEPIINEIIELEEHLVLIGTECGEE